MVGTLMDLQTVGNYDILGRLGVGGAGVVYKARHRLSEEIVAIKVLLTQEADNPVSFKRFEQEFRSARSLHHPHLVRALDFQQLDGMTCLIMEYVEGRSLGERLETSEPIAVPEAIEIIAQIGEVLDWVHAQGLLHRDIKPDNIVVTPDRIAKLTDLGLAKELLFDQNLTRTGSVLGTPNFMAPEQFRDAKRVDHRSDIYSLAATFYEMVTGVIPFDNSSPYDAWIQKSKNEFPSPRTIVPELPEHVDQAILRAMSGDPASRPGTCAEFIQELHPPAEEALAEDTWELIFDGQSKNDPLRISVAGLKQLLKSGQLNNLSDAMARRELNHPFKPVREFPEIRELLTSLNKAQRSSVSSQSQIDIQTSEKLRAMSNASLHSSKSTAKPQPQNQWLLYGLILILVLVIAMVMMKP